MFSVDGYTITLSRGDTGAIKVIADTDHTFLENDRALFSIKNGVGDVVKQQAFALDENNAFTVTLFNSDTDSLAPGTYSWDVRYVINPYYENGVIVNGDQVLTPHLPMEFTILPVVGEV